jgi:molybdopterin molybdotransferase
MSLVGKLNPPFLIRSESSRGDYGSRTRTQVEPALRKFLSYLNTLKMPAENVNLMNATGRVLAVRLKSPIGIPPFDRSTVDGFAIRSSDTRKGSMSHPISLDCIGKVGAGKSTRARIKPGAAIAIATGARVPDGADSVIMLEKVREEIKEGRIWISSVVKKGSNITRRGEDLKKGQVLLKEGTWLSASDVGLIASVGISHVQVYKKVRVAVLSTGNELAEPGNRLGNASVFDSNRFMICSMVKDFGGEPVDLGKCVDEKDQIHSELKRALKFDMILVSGGSSVGEKDYVPEIINKIGKPGIIIRGVAMKPGSPTSLGILNSKPVIVLPGFPVSAFVALYTFGRPLLYRLLRTGGPPVARVNAKMTREINLHKGIRTYLRVRIKGHRGHYFAEPITASGASLLSTLARSDGIVLADNKKRNNILSKGQDVQVTLLRNVDS